MVEDEARRLQLGFLVILAVGLLTALFFRDLPYQFRFWVERLFSWLPLAAWMVFFVGCYGAGTRLGDWLVPIVTGVALLIGGIPLAAAEGVRTVAGLVLLSAGFAVTMAGLRQPRPH